MGWAGYLKEWPGPDEGERPSAYIIMLGDPSISNSIEVDVGIAAQNILLAAVENGLGGCMFGSIKRAKLQEVLGVPDHLQIVYVLALGKPIEEVVLEEVGTDGSVNTCAIQLNR